MTIGTSLRILKGRALWSARVAWNWLSFRRGTRPRRVARRWVLVSARYVLARPRIRKPAHLVVRQAPLIERHLRQLVNPRFPAAELGRRGRELHDLLIAAIARRAEKAR